MLNSLYLAIDALLSCKDHVIIAIDGPAAAGKSTLAAALCEEYDACVIHMDDFFLPPAMRPPERLNEPGGNFDRERFLSEVLPYVGTDFTYGRYSCQTGLTEPVNAQKKPLNIIEGAYSIHPDFAGTYDLKVFLDIDEKLQAERIVRRSPELSRRFFNEWIPLENRYFEHFNIAAGCDIVLCAEL